MREIDDFGSYEEYKAYIKDVGQNIKFELMKENWTIEYRIWDVDGRIIRGIEHNPDKYHERIDAYDKIMELEIRQKGKKNHKAVVKKSREDTHDVRFMIMLGIYRAWHKKQKYEERNPNMTFVDWSSIPLDSNSTNQIWTMPDMPDNWTINWTISPNSQNE